MSAVDDLIALQGETPDDTGLPVYVPLPSKSQDVVAVFIGTPVKKEDTAPECSDYLTVFKRGYDPDEPRDRGKWTRGGGSGKKRSTVHEVLTVSEAIPLILAGEVVELKNPKKVHTLLDKLADIVKDAVSKGEDAPNYDACKITIKGHSFFCAHHLGYPRVKMPQLSGVPRPGTRADKLPRDDRGRVNIADEFVKHLHAEGIKTREETVPANSVMASQRELIGPVIAKRVAKGKYTPKKPIFVSNDDYIIDGHHRWASVIGRDAADKHLGDLTIDIIRVDAPITEILQHAKTWAHEYGMPRQGTAV